MPSFPSRAFRLTHPAAVPSTPRSLPLSHLLPRLAPTLLALLLVTGGIAPLASAANPSVAEVPAVQTSVFGRTPDGVDVAQFTLTNRHGAVASIITFGATLSELRVPDRNGSFANVVNPVVASAEGFQRGFSQSGAVIGRFANRIAGARFTLDGKEYILPANSGKNHIHGGRKNFAKVVWEARRLADPKLPAIELSYRSADGEEGFPGNLVTTVTYTLTETNTLRIEYRATTDQPTPVNLTNHAYFNLAPGSDVRTHQLMLDADHYTVVDAELIPTGEIRSVRGGPLDFTRAFAVGARATELPPNRRYDHNFVVRRPSGDKSLVRAARVQEPVLGRVMEVWTTEPGVQLYTSPLGDRAPNERPGFYCLETQHYPDSVNHPHFPSTIVRPGQPFRSTTEFRFSVDRKAGKAGN